MIEQKQLRNSHHSIALHLMTDPARIMYNIVVIMTIIIGRRS